MTSCNHRNLVLLGVGKLALAVAEQAQNCAAIESVTNLVAKANNSISDYRTVFGTTRNLDRMEFLADNGIKPLLIDILVQNLDLLSALAENADVLVSFPPDHERELLLAKACANAHRLIYISSTGVYGSQTGHIDESTQPAADSVQSKSRLKSEHIWQSHGASVLRSPAIYGVNRGLHLSLRQGSYTPPSNSTNFVSRIHQADLAQIILLGFNSLEPGETFVVGDKEPATHIQVVNWLCFKMGMTEKASSYLNANVDDDHDLQRREASPAKLQTKALRGDRQINGAKILERLDHRLLFPTFRDGYGAILNQLEE